MIRDYQAGCATNGVARRTSNTNAQKMVVVVHGFPPFRARLVVGGCRYGSVASATVRVFEIVAPHAVTNRVFTKALARALRRSAWFALPRFLLVGALGDMARELMLASQRAVPAKALDNGFEFRQPEIDAALAKALS